MTINAGDAGWKEFFPPARCVRLAVIGLLLFLVYRETVQHELVARWIHDANWSHGWLIPAFSLYLLYTRRAELLRSRPETCWWGAVILLFSLVMFFHSIWVVPRSYPRAISLVGSIFGVTLLLGGWSVMRTAWFPILFLGFAVPLPERWYVALTLPLRAFASRAAAVIMPWFMPGLFCEAQTVVIDYSVPGLPPGQLNVEEACSGMRTLMAFVTLSVAMAYLGDRPLWQRLVVVASCLPIALLCNTVRVVVTGLLHIKGHTDLARGTPHEMLGIATLGLGLGLFWLLGFTMRHLFVETDEAEPRRTDNV